MSTGPLDKVTVAITTFRRPERLARAVDSARAAGFTNIVVADGDEHGADLGCNQTWMAAAYRAKTRRVLLLHDDDTLHPDLGKIYGEIISVALDRRDAGFASWDAETKYDDGHTEPCPYWQGTVPSVMLSKKLLDHLDTCLTHSPVISILNRTILIRACKEAADHLITSESYERPGMLLGTELLVYYRHVEAFRRWLHVPKVLSYYGHHEGSGTVRAQLSNASEELVKGYNLARRQARYPAPEPSPRLIFVHCPHKPYDEAQAAKCERAQATWRWHFVNGDMIDAPFLSEGLPKIRDALDFGCSVALPEDIVVFSNNDAGLTTHAVEHIVAGIERGRGVTSCGHRLMDPESAGRMHKNLTNRRIPGGTELVAMTPAWWAAHRDKMPDMYLGREAWDTCFNALAEDWADGPGDVITRPDEWLTSRAHTDNVSWHEAHYSNWQTDRLGQRSGIGETQKHNRELARAFFAARGDTNMLAMLK